MTRFIIIKKKTLLIFSLLIIFILSILFIYINKNEDISTISQIAKPNHIYYYDFDGDGIKDELNISEINNYYEIKIKTNNKDYLLNCSNVDFLSIYPYYTLKVTILDLSRDNIPEIILANYYNNTPQYCIFKWTGENFENIFSCKDNVLGILNSDNSRTPIILKTNLANNLNFSASFLDNNSVKDVTSAVSNIVSLDEIEKFIDLIEYPYELTETPDIFTSTIASDELKLLWNLNKELYEYKFQTAYFHDIDWNTSGNPSLILWSLSFQVIDRHDNTKQPKEMILYIETTLDYLNQYKISSIKK